MKPGKRRGTGIIFGCIVLAAVLAVFALGIWKVNRKANDLGESVRRMQESFHLTAAADRNGYIPELAPLTDGWKVTQFGDVTAQQEMCYTITTPTGLVIVDGGYSYEVPRLRNIISQYGNCVEAWILTHPHPDHITAFMDIYEDPQGIVFHHIYAPELPDEETMAARASWDDFSALERFRSLEIPQLEYLHTGDTLDLLGLQVEILSAYDEQVDAHSRDLMNDGSLLFRISGKRDSMLFCADVGKNLTEYLTETLGDKLNSDYVQMGHHGFGGPGTAFYDRVTPRTAFFDAPDWLIHGEGDRSTREKENYMRNMGCEIVTWYTAPNQILIQ